MWHIFCDFCGWKQVKLNTKQGQNLKFLDNAMKIEQCKIGHIINEQIDFRNENYTQVCAKKLNKMHT